MIGGRVAIINYLVLGIEGEGFPEKTSVSEYLKYVSDEKMMTEKTATFTQVCCTSKISQTLQGGPVPVINGVMTPISMVITPFIGVVPPFTTSRGPPCTMTGIYPHGIHEFILGHFLLASTTYFFQDWIQDSPDLTPNPEFLDPFSLRPGVWLHQGFSSIPGGAGLASITMTRLTQ